MKKYLLIVCFSFFATGWSCAQNSFSNVYYSPGDSIQVRFLVPVFSPLHDGLYLTYTLGVDTGTMLLKTDFTGQLLFSRLYRKAGITSLYQIEGYRIYVFSDSLITILCRAGGTSLIIKTDLQGNVISSRQFAQQDAFIGYLKEYDGYLYGAGHCHHNSEASGFFCKMDLNGNVIWSHAFLDGAADRSNGFLCFTKTSDGGFLLVGNHGYYTTNSHSKLMMVKTDSTGAVQWQHHYHNFSFYLNLYPHEVVQTPDNGYLMLVNTFSNAYTHFVKTDNLGIITSGKQYTFNGAWGPFLFGLSPLSNGNYISGGDFFLDQGFNTHNPVAFEIDTGGTLVSFKSYPIPPTGIYFGKSSSYDPGHGLSITGYSSLYPGHQYLHVMVTDTLFGLDCGDSTGLPVPLNITVIDSVFTFNMIPVTRSTYDITAQITDTVMAFVTDPCIPTGLHQTPAKNELIIYPNPFYDVLTINSNLRGVSKTEISVADITGRKIHSQTFTVSPCKLQSAGWSTGLYFIHIKTEKGTIVKKVVKQ